MLRSCGTARYGPTSIVVVDKVDKKAVASDVAVPDDSNVRKKEHEDLEKHPGLREQLEMWGVKTSVIPMVIGAPQLGGAVLADPRIPN